MQIKKTIYRKLKLNQPQLRLEEGSEIDFLKWVA